MEHKDNTLSTLNDNTMVSLHTDSSPLDKSHGHATQPHDPPATTFQRICHQFQPLMLYVVSLAQFLDIGKDRLSLSFHLILQLRARSLSLFLFLFLTSTLLLPLLLVIVNGASMTVAMLPIAKELNFEVQQQQWLISSYAL